MNDKIFVISGNHAEFKTFMHKKMNQLCEQYNEEGRMFNISMSNFVYVSGPDTLRGHHNIHGYFYGTFRNRSDIRDIVRQIRLCNNIPGSNQLIPDLYVGRGMIPNPTKVPYL